MIKVTCELPVYEIDGQAPPMNGAPLIVQSHWNNRQWVVLLMPNGPPITVNAADLKAALENATNTKRF